MTTTKKTTAKYITFNKEDAAELYELAYDHFIHSCFSCAYLRKKLRKFIGNKEAVRIARIVKKHPYCTT